MRDEGLPAVVIRTFRHYYEQLVSGHTGLIRERDLEPVRALADADALGPALADEGRAAMSSTVVIKLNGGLGTSMGLDRAKSLLVVKDGLSFLDIVAEQARRAGTPLVLMNSFSTRDDSLAALARHAGPAPALPRDFMQHKVPKVLVEDLSPARWPADPELAWCPPGHGDLYTALITSGMLETLRAAGYRRAFVSNSDNLGAVVDATILGHFVERGLPFMMEVCDRTAADRKGGHLARLAGGRLVLRESAQCADDDADAFQDIELHRYFNTNNLWLDLEALAQALDRRDGVLGLAMIRNRKTVDPRDASSPAVYQLETAMGSAIEVFEGAEALRVPRSRFAPVKTTSDLLAVRSDDYVLDDGYRIVPSPARVGEAAVVELDPRFYRLIDQFEARFAAGVPSLVGCDRLRVRGDVHFGGEVVAVGSVDIDVGDAAARIPDGSRLDSGWSPPR